jgi:hypothetical protein
MGTPAVMILLASDPIQNQPMPFSPWRIAGLQPDEPYARGLTVDVAVEDVFDAVADLLAARGR